MTEATEEQVKQWQMQIVNSVCEDIRVQVEGNLYDSAVKNAKWLLELLTHWEEGAIYPPDGEEIEEMIEEEK